MRRRLSAIPCPLLAGLLVFLKRAAWNDAMRHHPFYDELARRIPLP